MILVGSQRGGASQLASHLMNDRDNDHVTVEELRGFLADDLHGALSEAHAIAKGTRCKQFLFSLSFNPPKNADISIDGLREAADRAEDLLGLAEQPRAIVIHEKNGRRHAHVVWSRIDADEMKAINLPHFKSRLGGLSKDLYLEHGWELPEGHRANGWKSPLNFTLAEWQQAKRLDLDPREIKQIFQSCWQQSDGLNGLRHALEEHGYFLAKGDRRGVVALDIHGEVYSVARWTGVKTKELQARLRGHEALPAVADVSKNIRSRMSQRLRAHIQEDRQKQREEEKPLLTQRASMVAAQRAEREQLARRQEQRLRLEQKQRAERLHTGIRGVWELLTGKARAIRKQNEQEAYQGYLRDRDQRERVYAEQAKERKAIQQRMDALQAKHREERMRLARLVVDVLRHSDEAARMKARAMRLRERGQDLDLGL